jgi:pimeloyl-ACP methyl ester carboxylesterase
LPSHFRDNEKVVWDGGRLEDPEKGERGKGIRAALEEFRGNGIAATQADVVGHSMGGVLARVYAEGRHLDYTVRQIAENWYRRPDNFQAGDINRLITIGSTHLGTHISGFLQHYSYYAETNPPNGVAKTPPSPVVAATLRNTDLFSSASALGWVYWGLGNMVSSRFPRGAFTDQIPGSKALMGILSPNPVAVHAIACVATVADLDLFQGIQGKKGLYRTQMEMIWDYTPGWFLCEILRNRLKQPEDAADLEEILRKIENLKKKIRDNEIQLANLDRELSKPAPTSVHSLDPSLLQGIVVSLTNLLKMKETLLEQNLTSTKELEMLEEKGKLRLISAIFGNDYSDFTVSLSSQLGGLKKPYVTIIPTDYRTAKNGVLHSYEPRHKVVQARVIELLIGGMESFDSNGFPATRFLPSEGRPPGWPAYYAPSKGEAFKPYEQLP